MNPKWVLVQFNFWGALYLYLFILCISLAEFHRWVTPFLLIYLQLNHNLFLLTQSKTIFQDTPIPTTLG